MFSRKMSFMKRTPFKRIISEVPQQEAHDGVGLRRVLLSSDLPIAKNLQAMTHGIMKPRTSLGWHLHDDKDEVILLIRGNGVVHIDGGESLPCAAGDVLYIPAGNRHRIENLSDSELEGFFFRVFAEAGEQSSAADRPDGRRLA